jgi:transposase
MPTESDWQASLQKIVQLSMPVQYSSGRRQRTGQLSKQGNLLLRFLWRRAGMKSPMATTRMTPVCH